MPAISPSTQSSPSRPATQCHVLLDFDGTIAPDDPTDRLLEWFAEPAWRDIEAEWQAGRISSRECMERHAALLRATPQELDQAISTIRIDPAVHAFVAFCRRRSLQLSVVSDGFDRVLRAILDRERLTVPFFTNQLEWQGGNRWSLAFPYARNDCRSGGGNCKCAHGVDHGSPCVVIGDGRSDFCMAERADYVIAKGSLKRFCREHGLQHAPFTTFDDVTARLAEWLTRLRPSPRRPLSNAAEEPLGRRT